tara:strand:+ start:19882 stop:20055 length:174 start_codon:yes stop_codon:yes gene_type:complete
MENKDLGLVLLIIGALGFSEQITKMLKLKKMYKIVYYIFVLSLGYSIYSRKFLFNIY